MKIFKFIIAVLILGSISSCDYLDVVPDDVATIDHAFSNRYNAERFLMTCYSFLPNFPNANSNPALSAGDEVWYPETYKNWDRMRVARGEQNLTNPAFDYWRGGFYTGIRNCNIFLEKIDNVLDLDQYEREKWVAEVNFLKAYYHFTLIRMYGPIHIKDVSLPVSSSTEAIKEKRQPVDECFAYVVSLLDLAIADLPETLQNESSELGRITKPIAAAIKARVLMTAASPLFNGNEDYSNFIDKDGVRLFNTTYDASKWEKAATACKEAIDLCHSAGKSLYQKEDYKNPFPQNDTTLMKAALRSVITEEWNNELIWGYTGSGIYGLQSESQPRLYGLTTNPVASRHAPTIRIAEQFYSSNGVPIEEDASWGDYDDRFQLRTSTYADRFYVEQGEQTARLNFDREFRYYSSLSFDRGTWFGNGRDQTDTDPWYIHSRKGEFASVFEVWDQSMTGYWPKKLVHLENEIKNGTSYSQHRYAFPVVRLADLYLYYAEALNEVKSAPDAEVYEYIDLVRSRAGLDGVVASWAAHSKNPTKPSTQAGMREIIHRERLIELAFEGARFWDLRRWKKAKEVMNAPIRGWNTLKNDVRDYYRILVLHNQTFTQRDYLWPIAENETIKNPNLIQNPGW